MDNVAKGKIQVTCVRLCIDGFDHENLTGTINGVALRESVFFDGLVDFVAKLDEVYNLIGRPQPFNVIRSFNPKNDYQTYQGNPVIFQEDKEIEKLSGKLLTLDLNMLTRQGAEWQGQLHYPCGKKLGNFKTTMECIKLIEQVLR